MLLNRNPRLRLKVTRAIRALEKDIRRLNATLARFEAMEKEYEEKAKKAAVAGRESMVKALANSIATIREHIKVVMFMKMCFESICARLKMIFELGNVMSDITPLRNIVKLVGPVVAKFMLQLEQSIDLVSETLDVLVDEMEGISSAVTPVELESEEAAKILEAINLSVGREAERALPELDLDLEEPVHHREKLRNRGEIP
ncbi:MAG TPA: hypothetical protein ENF34_04215 [Candidatus Bathyarchaeota archaeon]|nr:hypothetical protein [Candidatus Bathyarchaeota archaeon]